MGLRSGRQNQVRRHRHSLGHVKLSFAELEELVARWENLCDEVVISIGDGLTADYVDDLLELQSNELSNLVIRTEEPKTLITLRRSKAELSYIEDPQFTSAILSIRNSLKPFRISTPFYRLRAFWAWLYMLLITFALFADYRIQGSHLPPPPPPLVFPLLPPMPPMPPMPPQVPIFYIMLALTTFLLLTGWFIYAYNKISNQSSTRIIRKKNS